MHQHRFVPRLRQYARAIIVGLGTSATLAAHAAVITQNTVGTLNTGGSDFSLGQSVTTGAGGPWNQLTFNFVDAAGNAYASGGLYLLSQAYSGSIADLSTSTAGFIARTNTIAAGVWDFDDAVTVSANTQYFLYTDTAFDGSRQVRFSEPSSYAGGDASQAIGAGAYQVLTRSDLVFSLNGTATAVPEPASFALVGIALLGAATVRRRATAP